METLSNFNVTIDDQDQIRREDTIQQCSARVITEENRVELTYKKRRPRGSGVKPARPFSGEYCFVSQHADGNLVIQMTWHKDKDITDELNAVKLELNQAADVVHEYSSHK